MSQTTDNLKDVLESIKSDRDTRKVFLAMTEEDKWLAVLGMIAFNLNQQVTFQKEVRERADQRIRMERELGEKLHVSLGGGDDDDTLTTTQKVQAVITAQYGGFIKYFLDIFKSILTTVLTIVTIALLYFIFGGKMPTP